MHAIGNEVKKKDPTKKLLYVTSERFINDLVNATQSGKIYDFRMKYRNIDILFIDDVHFIAGKERTQEEFFHTFNSLYNANKQIVLTSDRPPKEIPTLEDRLRSRFEWGFVVDIQNPHFETRLAILRKKAETKHIDVPYEILSLVATYVVDNIRELEGSLNKIIAYSTLTGKKVTLALAKEVLKDVLPDEAMEAEAAALAKAKGEAAAIEAGEKKVEKKEEKEEEATVPEDFEPEWGVTFLSKELKASNAYRFFTALVKNGANGIVVTRIHPDKARKNFNIPENVKIYWLSKAPGEYCRTPTNIGKLAFTVTEFAKKNKKAIILLDGFEYLVSNNDFPMIMRWLDDVHESIVLSDSIFIVPITPDTYTTKELTLLERNTRNLSDREIKYASSFLKEKEAQMETEDIEEEDVSKDKEEERGGKPPGEKEEGEDEEEKKVKKKRVKKIKREKSPMERELRTAIKLARTKIQFAKSTGADVTEAEGLLQEAESVAGNEDYKKAIDIAKESAAVANQATDRSEFTEG